MSHFDVNNLTELWRNFSKSSSKTYRSLFYKGFSAIQGLQLALFFTFILICLPYECIGCEAAICNRRCAIGTAENVGPRLARSHAQETDFRLQQHRSY